MRRHMTETRRWQRVLAAYCGMQNEPVIGGEVWQSEPGGQIEVSGLH